jgi:hypothetical protein
VFDHLQRHRRQVEHLPAFHPHLGCVPQLGAASRARAGLVPLALVRVVDQRQRRPRMTGLPTRPTATPPAQRLRRRLGKRRVRRRRPRRIPAVLPQPPPQLGNLSLELLDPLGLPHDERRELLIRRTPVSRHPAMIDKSRRRSSSHAGDLTSFHRRMFGGLPQGDSAGRDLPAQPGPAPPCDTANEQHLYRGSFCWLQIEHSDEFNRLAKDFIENT